MLCSLNRVGELFHWGGLGQWCHNYLTHYEKLKLFLEAREAAQTRGIELL
ncbi:hypothetical protein [Trichocoleus sp. FACHB-262]|nr:hypothetical protein [Trichocoleus sp. FACHB-262]